MGQVHGEDQFRLVMQYHGGVVAVRTDIDNAFGPHTHQLIGVRYDDCFLIHGRCVLFAGAKVIHSGDTAKK